MTADPKVFTKASLTGVEDEHPSLHAGYNDDIDIEADPGTCVGRTDHDRGPAQSVPIGCVPAYASAAAFPTSPAPPPGYTTTGFDRETNQLKVWDPDAGAWITV